MYKVFVSGITPMEAYPTYCSSKHCKQCIEKLELCIPCAKPDIEEINEIQISSCIESAEIIETVLGHKLVIEGVFGVKAIYTADNRVQSVHSAHCDIGFYEYILLKGVHAKGCNELVSEVFVGIEDVCIMYVDRRRIYLGVIYIVCPKCKEHVECKDNLRCDSEVNHVNNMGRQY